MPKRVQNRLSPARQALERVVDPVSSTSATPAISPPRAMIERTQNTMATMSSRQATPTRRPVSRGGRLNPGPFWPDWNR